MSEHQIPQIDIYSSQLQSWANCPQKADHRRISGGDYDEDYSPVSIEVSNAVHASVMGKEYHTADKIAFDKKTPDKNAMQNQIILMSRKIDYFLESKKLEIVGSNRKMEAKINFSNKIIINLLGESDIELVDKNKRKILLALKTGSRPPSPQLQLASYYYLSVKGDDNSFVPDAVAWLFCPRGVKGELQWNEIPTSEDMLAITMSQMKSIYFMTANDMPYNPSTMNCSGCMKDDCIVRSK